MAFVFKHQLNCWLLVALLIAVFPTVRPQSLNNSTTCSRETLNAKTIFEFWQENSRDCRPEAETLYKIHRKISLNKQNNDKITDLVDNHVKTSLMESLFDQLIAAISTKSFNTKPVLEKVINQLLEQKKDKDFVIKICQKVLDEIVIFMDEEDILQQVFLITNDDLKLNILEYFLKKYGNQYKNNSRFMPLLTFGVSNVLKQRQQNKSPLGDPIIGRLLSKLPEQLLTLYQSWNYNVSLLNSHYNEYIFPERSLGSADNKRYLFNFLPTKNRYKVKGKFKLQFNAKGLITFGAPYDGSYKYLTAEKKSVYICLDCAIDSAQWWQVLWPNVERPTLLLQNLLTQDLLCATKMFNENFVLISSLDLEDNISNTACQWKVEKRDK